jgi:RNA polymerase sigma factor (sigma-70 family)
MKRDTPIEAPRGGFPVTRPSVVLAAGSGDPETRRRAFDVLVASYWKPVYKYVRLKWQAGTEDAEDLTQGFFARAFEKGFFDRYDPSVARFRTYLRTCLDGFVANQRKAARRLKRGGGVQVLPLDFEGAEGELRRHEPSAGVDPEEYFQREWVRSLFALAVEELRAHLDATGRTVHFRLFERYDLEAPDSPERPSYARLGSELSLTTTQVTNYLAAARRELRRLVLDKLRAQCGTEAEFRSEARHVLGIDPP